MLGVITPGYYAGMDGRVFLNTMEMAITGFKATDSNPMSDRTNSLTKGQQAGTRTIQSLNGSFDCVVSNDASGDPQFGTGHTYPIWLLNHDGRGYFCLAYIETCEDTVDIKGDQGFSVTFKSNYVAATGITPWTNADLASLPSGVIGQGASAQGTV